MVLAHPGTRRFTIVRGERQAPVVRVFDMEVVRPAILTILARNALLASLALCALESRPGVLCRVGGIGLRVVHVGANICGRNLRHLSCCRGVRNLAVLDMEIGGFAIGSGSSGHALVSLELAPGIVLRIGALRGRCPVHGNTDVLRVCSRGVIHRARITALSHGIGILDPRVIGGAVSTCGAWNALLPIGALEQCPRVILRVAALSGSGFVVGQADIRFEHASGAYGRIAHIGALGIVSVLYPGVEG